MRWAKALVRAGSTVPNGPSWPVTVSVAFSATLRLLTSPCRWRSSGMRADPGGEGGRHAAGAYGPAVDGRSCRPRRGADRRWPRPPARCRWPSLRRARPPHRSGRTATRAAGTGQGQVLDRQELRGAGPLGRGPAHRGGTRAGGLAGHRLHQRLVTELGHGCGQDVGGIAVDRDRGAEVVHLLQVVGDEEEGDPLLGLQVAELGEEAVDAAGVELRGRLVENDEAGAEGQRPGYLDELPLLDGQVPGPRGGVDGDAVLAEELLGAQAELLPADGPQRVSALPVQEEVLGDGQLADDRGALVDAGDLGAPGVDVAEGRRRLAREAQGSGVGRLEAGEDGHERRLAGAVASHQGVRLARGDADAGVAQRDGGAESFADAGRLGHRGRVAGTGRRGGRGVRHGGCRPSFTDAGLTGRGQSRGGASGRPPLDVAGGAAGRQPTLLPHRDLSSTLSLVTSGAGSWSSRPFGILMMVESWSVAPG